MVGLTALGAGLGGFHMLQRGKIRIAPLEGKKYSPSFLELCQTKNFKTIQEAVRSVKDRTICYELVYEESKLG